MKHLKSYYRLNHHFDKQNDRKKTVDFRDKNHMDMIPLNSRPESMNIVYHITRHNPKIYLVSAKNNMLKVRILHAHNDFIREER